LRVPAPRIASRRLVAAAAARPGAGAWETAAVSALPCPLLFTSALQGSCERERHEPCHGVRVVLPNGFIEPCLPSPAPKPPAGAGWIHEIKLDGFRLLARRDAAGVRLLTRRGIDWTNRYPTVAAAVAALAARIEAMARAPAPPARAAGGDRPAGERAGATAARRGSADNRGGGAERGGGAVARRAAVGPARRPRRRETEARRGVKVMRAVRAPRLGALRCRSIRTRPA
jgi:hypothetical protein